MAAAEYEAAGVHVTEWAASGPTVLCLHGLTSTGAVWQMLAEHTGDARVIAPDLRGRGQSPNGPGGLRGHARDVHRLADELGLDDIVLVGHSMGAFLAPLVARDLGERIARVVLVDGGLPPALPWFMRRAVVRATFNQSIKRRERQWSSPDAYATEVFGRALRSAPERLAAMTAIAATELDGSGRPRLDRAHAVADAVDTFFGPDVVPALSALSVPTRLLAASAGNHDRAKPFLSDGVVAEWTARLPTLHAERLVANHLTILFAPEVAVAAVGASASRGQRR